VCEARVKPRTSIVECCSVDPLFSNECRGGDTSAARKGDPRRIRVDGSVPPSVTPDISGGCLISAGAAVAVAVAVDR
jgi:hypothetical protein